MSPEGAGSAETIEDSDMTGNVGSTGDSGDSAVAAANGSLASRLHRHAVSALSAALALFVLIEVNFSLLTPLRQLALFAAMGLVLCFLNFPASQRWATSLWVRGIDAVLLLLTVATCGYLLMQGAALGQRAAMYSWQDIAVGSIGLVLVLEAARRSIGWALPILAILFLLYAHESVAQQLPDWMFPHRGQDWEALIGQTYLRTEGVFGTALGVMFRYVFLFVLFGAFLQASGATQYIIELATQLLGRRSGGPAKVSVLASGLMGSLSGSAVANAATTGTFTIPLMRSIGLRPHVAAGIEAAASSGGALVPPVMGAGAYMMLEIINRDPPVTYLEILRAALIPALLYYLSIFLLVHFTAKRIDAEADARDAARRETNERQAIDAAIREAGDVPEVIDTDRRGPLWRRFEGITFFGALGSLMAFLLVGYSPFRAVTYALALVMGLILVSPQTRAGLGSRIAAVGVWVVLTWAAMVSLASAGHVADALIWGMAGTLLVGIAAPTWRSLILSGFRTSAGGGIPLIAAAACVGIVIGLVSRTGIGTGLPQAIIPLAGNSLFLALLAIMGCSIVLGMGLPSAVSYLLLATIIGPVFANPDLGVPILAAHLFIFYFGMMAMVTPPVALAAYATASIAGTSVMRTGLAAFRFALVGFTLPYMFVYRPALLLMAPDGGPASWLAVVWAVTAAALGVFALAAAMAGFLLSRLSLIGRCVLFAAAACALFPDRFEFSGQRFPILDLTGLVLITSVVVWQLRLAKRPEQTATSA